MKSKLILCLLILNYLLYNCQPHKKIYLDQNFTNALYENNIDLNKNGYFEENEILNVTELNLTQKNITNISGIENFKNLKELILNRNYIRDFSPLNKLEKLEILGISQNQNPQEIDLSRIKNLKILYGAKSNLNEIKLNNQIQLLYLGDNNFTNFDASKYINLESLNLDGCKNLTEVNISKNLKIYQLYFYGTAIKELNISNNKNIKTIYVEPNVKLIKSFMNIRNLS
ncbi:leucine-rich repeat domain-containing protein [Chryseobacterium sp. RR2-3-20]|uniref:leucine-rich repeat domain-containing protein n=1 Tax=Chryseobacterium sp. RR2-3-20 TaxID=2787626 RepID=UPI001ADF3294|nr:leucine-rich repeat domain-containing protein [Chryseobacterium sp. RR2-3-20]